MNDFNTFLCSLYCHSLTSEDRLSALFVLSEILDQITLIIAPILPHLTEEIEMHHPWRAGLERFTFLILDTIV